MKTIILISTFYFLGFLTSLWMTSCMTAVMPPSPGCDTLHIQERVDTVYVDKCAHEKEEYAY